MSNPRLAARYAKSIFDFAIEKGELEKVYEDMKMLHDICKKSSDFVAILHSPIIPVDKKEKIIGDDEAAKLLTRNYRTPWKLS